MNLKERNMSEVKKGIGGIISIETRKFKCIGCGNDRACFLEINQEKTSSGFDGLLIEDLKCVLDSTNQTSYNWEEIFKKRK